MRLVPRQFHPPRRRIERREEYVLGEYPRPSEAVQERRLPRVGVTRDCHRRNLVLLAARTLSFSSRLHLNNLLAKLSHSSVDSTTIELNLGFTWTTRTHTYTAGCLATGLALVFTVTIFVAAIKAWYCGQRVARYFIIAWSAFLLGGVVNTLMVLGYLPNVFITMYASQLGSALEVALLSLALADRINSLREQQALLDNAGVGIVFIRQRVIVRCNQCYADIFGYAGETRFWQALRTATA